MPPSSVRAARDRLVIATANAGKLREFRALLSGLPFEIVSQGELGIPAPEETGASFLDNALLKARHASAAACAAAIADDSGLEVDVLAGAPGIYSARYAGPAADDAANNARLQSELRRHPAPWPARYRCVLVFVDNAADPAPLTATASWEGRIIDAARGTGGFGYDPYFWLPELDRTAAELSAADKNARSHRGRAMALLALQLRERLLPAGLACAR